LCFIWHIWHDRQPSIPIFPPLVSILLQLISLWSSSWLSTGIGYWEAFSTVTSLELLCLDGSHWYVHYGFGPVTSLVFGAGGLGHEAGGLWPPPVSPAPMAGRRARHCYSALGSGFGGRHWVFLLSLSYISPWFSLSLDRQTIELLYPFSFALNRLWARRFPPNRPLSINQLIRPAIFPWVDFVSPPILQELTWCLPFFVGWLGVPFHSWVDLVSAHLWLTLCPRSLGWLGVPTPWVDLVSPVRGLTWCPRSLGWLGVPASWVDLVSPLPGLTWCPRSLGWLGVPAPWVDLVSPLLGWTWCPRTLGGLGIPTLSVDCVTTTCQLGDDIPFPLTW